MNEVAAERVDVPGVCGDAEAAALRASLDLVPLTDRRDRPWTAAQWMLAALGCGLGQVVGPVVPGWSLWLAGATTIAVLLAGRRMNTTRQPVGKRARLVVRVLMLVWAAVAAFVWFSGMSALFAWFMTGVFLLAGAREVERWRAGRTDPGPWWPRGSEPLAVLAVIDDARRRGVLADWVPRVAGLDPARAQTGLDRLVEEGLVAKRTTWGLDRDRPLVATAEGRARLAAWRRALSSRPSGS